MEEVPMKQITRFAVLCGFIAAAFAPAAAQEKTTPADAIAYVKKAIAYMKANGAEKAFVEFRNKKGKFIDRDLYISVYDLKGFCVAHPDPKKNKTDLSDEKDPAGKLVIKERLALATQYSKGWATYKGKSLDGTAVVDKSVYLEKEGDYIVCCAVYGLVQ